MNSLLKEIVKESHTLNVLYVEDHIETLEGMTMILEQMFHSIDTAINGEEALLKYNEYYNTNNQYYDLIITDITMPKMDGLELIKEVFKINLDQVIVITSANDNLEQTIELLNLGINYFVRKPIEYKAFEKVLFKAIKFINNEKKLEQKTKELHELNNTLEEKVEHQTLSLYQSLYYDELTKLPKRNKLVKDLKELEPSGFMILNINEFKDINSVYGYKAGDDILVELSRKLLNIALERRCNIYHLGGDEFGFLNFINGTPQYCKETAEIILEMVEKEGIAIDINGEKINIVLNITLGMSSFTKSLIKTADLALKYAIKHRIPYFIYDENIDLEKESSNKIETVKLIRKALENDLITPYFQPIFTKDGRVKYETLVRIVDGDKVYSPYAFLETAKIIRLYSDITKKVIEKAFVVFENRSEEFSINLSFEDIINKDTMTYLFSKLEEHAVNDRLIVEILESENIEDFTIVKEFIQKIKALGVRIAIDDFGSGYSNFSYIIQLEPDFIKIDGSIIKDIDTNKNSYKITENLIQFANKLNATTVTEYVHSKEVYDKVKELGADAFQGFYLAEPSILK